MKSTRHAMVGLVAAAALVVTAACTDDDELANPQETDTPEAPDPTAPATGDPQDGDGSEVDSGEITPPGTELTVGDTAVVPLRDGVVALTVTSIEEGDDQAAFQAEVGDNAEGWVAYHIWITAENVSDEDMSFVGLPKLKAVMADGEPTRFSLIGTPDFDSCEHVAFPADAGAGAAIETCSMTAVPEGETPAGAQWEDRDAGYNDDPIIWRQ